MLKEIFKKGNRIQIVVLIIAIVTILGLIYPKQKDIEPILQQYKQEVNAEVDDRVQDTDNQIVGLKDSIKSTDNRLSNTASSIAQLENRISNIDSDLRNIRDYSIPIDNINNNITSINQLISEIEDRLELLEISHDQVSGVERVLYSHDLSSSISWCPVIGNGWVGQQFKTGNRNADITRIKLHLLRRAGTPQTLEIKIYGTTVVGILLVILFYTR